jgi:hypothetical protein
VYSHGLPDQFLRNILKKSRYIFNVRGHDFLAHDGHWRSRNQTGNLDARKQMIGEIDELHQFVCAVEANESKAGGEELLVTFGPAPGSFFADDRRSRYRWANLPTHLEDTLQRLVCKHGYGRIVDVTINSTGGWVVQLKNDDFEFGGELPARLQSSLQEGKKRKSSIKVCGPCVLQWTEMLISSKRLYLNHQNPDEYLLIFKDGKTCICLHAEAEPLLKKLVERSTKKKLSWNFQSSCFCDPLIQRRANAAYYNSRGRFQLFRGAPEQALGYLQEALRLENSSTYWKDYGMALVAVRKTRQDPILESWLSPSNLSPQPLYDPHDVDGFRSDYFKVVGRESGTTEFLSSRLQQVRLAATNGSSCWGCLTGKTFVELTPQLDNLSWADVKGNLVELPGFSGEGKRNVGAI